MKPSLGGLARRYARALLDVSREGERTQEVAADLKQALDTMAAHAELRAALLHPALGPERKRAIVTALWKQGLVARLLALLAERGRLELLGAIQEAFERAWNESRGVASGEAASAVPLAAGQLEALGAALGSSLGRRVELKTRVEPGLLGGLRVSVGGRTYDGSLRSQLQSLRSRLAGGGP